MNKHITEKPKLIALLDNRDGYCEQLMLYGTIENTKSVLHLLRSVPKIDGTALVNNSKGLCFEFNPTVFRNSSTPTLFSASNVFPLPPDSPVVLSIVPKVIIDHRYYQHDSSCGRGVQTIWRSHFPNISRKDIFESISVPFIDEHGREVCTRAAKDYFCGCFICKWGGKGGVAEMVTLHSYLMLQDLARTMGMDNFVTNIKNVDKYLEHVAENSQ